MSADLRKMSDLIYDDNICYVKIPLEYMRGIDLDRYVFNVAARFFDNRFNSHVFSLPVYQPNAALKGNNINFYTPVLAISGAAENIYQEHIDDGNDVIIQKPIGMVKIDPNDADGDSIILYGDSEDGTIDLNGLNVVGFKDDTIDIMPYQRMYDLVVSEGLYHGVLTDCYNNNTGTAYYSGADNTYHTFISKVTNPINDDDIAGFIAVGTTRTKMTAKALKDYISEVFSIYSSVQTVVLNGDTRAQFYQYIGNQWTMPMSKLPIDYYLHNDDVATGIVLYEKPIARIPDPIEDGSKQEKDFSLADYCTLRVMIRNDQAGEKLYVTTPCYLDHTSESYLLGYITNPIEPAKVDEGTTSGTISIRKWYRVAEIYTTDEVTYGSEGDLPPWDSEWGPGPKPTGFDYTGNVLWLRIYDKDPENQCWIKHVGARKETVKDGSVNKSWWVGTRLRELNIFYFTINGSMPNFKAYKWQYTVKKDNRTDPTTFTDWHDFVYELSPGEDPSNWIRYEKLGYSLISNVDYSSEASGAAWGLDTWFTATNQGVGTDVWPYVYIKATPVEDPNPYKITYLNTTNNDNLVSCPTNDGSYVWYYSQAIQSNLAGTGKFSNSNLIIDPYIYNDKIRVVVDYIDDTNSGEKTKWDSMGIVDISQMVSIGPGRYNYVAAQDGFYARGSKIAVDVTTKNGWNYNSIEIDYGTTGIDEDTGEDYVILDTRKDYDTAIIKVHFSKKTDPYYLVLENTDPSKGSIECVGATYDPNYIYDTNKRGAYVFYAGDTLEFIAHPKTVDDKGYQLTNKLAAWEYEYTNDDSTTEWRLVNNKQHCDIIVDLYQIGNTVHKDLYRYRAVWGYECFIY